MEEKEISRDLTPHCGPGGEHQLQQSWPNSEFY